MINCAHCSEQTPETRNFCVHCGHKVRDLKAIRLGVGTRRTPSIDLFWESGDPSVFASKGALDYNNGKGENHA